MVTALAEPLRERDRTALQDASRIALAFDERDAVMILHVRCLIRPKSPRAAVYECLLGPVRDFGTGWKACADAVRQALRDACFIRSGRREPDGISGRADRVDEDLFAHLCSKVEVAVADGGPDVQKAMMMMSPAGGDAHPLFPRLRHTTRDRAHRFRSVQKGMWQTACELAGGFLSALITGEQSLARMLETSRKYSLIFERVQREQRIQDPTDANLFAKTLRNFQFKDSRFDSRSRPLLTLLSMLPVVISTLQLLLHEGDDGDRRWALKLLRQFGGEEGFDRLLRYAV
jgi:hypothetical protein